MYLKELDSITHLSFDRRNKILQGAGLSRGSDVITEEGDRIKAGKFPLMFFANTAVDSNKKRHIKNSTNYKNRKIMNRVNGTLSKNHIDSSSYAQGPKNSV